MDALLELDRVSKGYRRGRHELLTLVGLSLTIRAGELLAVWGARGMGRTTLLKVAAGLMPPDSGTVRLDGRDLVSMSNSEQRDEIGWTRSEGPRHDTQMIDYVAEPLRKRHRGREARRRAATALARTGAYDYAEGRWGDLPDEARVLVGIARALAPKPRLLVADDPTWALDRIQSESLMRMLRDEAQESGIGVLITVPDMPEMLHAHRIAVLSDGQLILPADPPEDYQNVIEFPRRLAGMGRRCGPAA